MLTRSLAIAVFWLSGTVLYGQGTQPFSLEEVMSSPFPSGLVSSPYESKLAWVRNAEGVRNIWISEAPNYIGRQITNYPTDDGQAISDLQFTPNDGGIIYVRGSNANRQGEFPNPAIIGEGVQQEIRLIDLGSGNDTKIADGRNPKIAPDRPAIAYIKKGQVWYKNLDNEEEPQKLITTRGSASSIRWSPSGDKIAFVSHRGDHGFVGVYHFSSKKLIYLGPSVDADSSPAWSPDGSQVAFIRIPSIRDELTFEPHRERLPWSIAVGNATNGEVQVVWTADEGRGSVFRSISASNQIFWSSTGHLVFPWEKYGWTNLFAIELNSKKVTRLTNGDFEVQFVSSSSDRSEILYSSNQEDIDRQHLWKVNMSGKASRLSDGEGIEWWPVSMANGKLASIASGPTTPAYAVIWENGKAKSLVEQVLPSKFPKDELVKPEQVVFSGADGMKIHGQLFKPKNQRRGQKYPAVLFFHGGSRRQMLLGFHHRGYYHNAYAMNQYLASQGYLVLSVNYRSGIGYGMEFREALNYGATGASEFNDVLGAGLYMQSRDDVDPERIGLWGGSYGGFLTAMGLARASDLFAAGVDIHGAHDWNVIVKNFIPNYNPLSRPEFAKLAYDSSPIAYMDTWESPVLLIHGDDDRNVPFSETVTIAELLRKQGVEFEQLIFPDEVHGFLLHQNWVNAYKAAAEFLDRKLK